MRHINRVAIFDETFDDRLRAFATPWELTCFVWIPGIAIGFAAWEEAHSPISLEDFGIFRKAAVAVLHGQSPYVTPVPDAFVHFNRFVYPPVAALLFAPFAAMPSAPAEVLMFVGGFAAILSALRVLGVRDWRCYGLTLVSAPALNSVALGTLTSFLLLGAALVWRYRDNPVGRGGRDCPDSAPQALSLAARDLAAGD